MGLKKKVIGLLISFSGLAVGYYYFTTLTPPQNLLYGAIGAAWFLLALYGTLKT